MKHFNVTCIPPTAAVLMSSNIGASNNGAELVSTISDMPIDGTTVMHDMSK
jgi:hypothetical protein